MAFQGDMLSKTLVIGIILLFIVIGTFNVVASMSVEKQKLVTQGNSSKQGGNTLIAETEANRVIEVDSGGTIVWEKAGLDFPVDAERLGTGNTLIAEFYGSRVIEVDSSGTIVWSKTAVYPIDAERLSNGNTLIVEVYGSNRVIEVDNGGNIVWEYGGLHLATDAERLANGNTLIASFFGSRVIEVDSTGTIVWQKAGLYSPWDAERLFNGNTLIVDAGDYSVIEVDNAGTIVWQKTGLVWPTDGERFENGNTLITELQGDRVIEVDSSGTIVWEKANLSGPSDAERISKPPNAPTIIGQTSGKTGTEYEFTFKATDPDGDKVRYIIYWGDNTSNTTGYNPSGTDVKVKHIWSNDGTYNITAKAQDIYGFEGPEGKLTVTMPKTKSFNFNFNLLGWLFERFPLLERLLSLIGVAFLYNTF